MSVPTASSAERSERPAERGKRRQIHIHFYNGLPDLDSVGLLKPASRELSRIRRVKV